MALCTLYVLYETERDWSFTQKASEGIVAVAFGFLFIEQIGFLLAPLDFGGVAIFLGVRGQNSRIGYPNCFDSCRNEESRLQRPEATRD